MMDWRYKITELAPYIKPVVICAILYIVGYNVELFGRHYKIFCVNGNTGFRNESRIF